MKLIRPSKEEVNYYTKLNEIPLAASAPTHDVDEWDQSHREFVLKVLLPSIRPPVLTRRVVVESYLTDVVLDNGEKTTFEQGICNGSSFVPNVSYDWGYIKDVWSMAHDYCYFLHRNNLTDIFGKRWNLRQAHKIYWDGFCAQRKTILGTIYATGLLIGGWVIWYTDLLRNRESVDEIVERDSNDWVLPRRSKLQEAIS